MNTRKNKGNLIRQCGSKAVWEWPVLALQLLFICYVAHRISMRGLAYLGGPFLLYLGLGFFADASGEMIRRRVRFYRTKDAFLSANRVYHILLIAAGLLCAAGSAAAFLFSDQLSGVLFHTVLSSLAVKLLAPALFLRVMTLCIGGYLDGMGIDFPVKTAKVASAVASLAAAFFFSGKLLAYAEKVSGLMRTEEYYYAYLAALGAGGVLIGDLFAFVLMLFMKASLMRRLHKMYDGGALKHTGSTTELLLAYFLGILSECFSKGYGILVFLILLVFAGSVPAQDNAWAGWFFASCMLLLPAALLLQRQLTGVLQKQMQRELKRGDLPRARERMAIVLKVYMYMLIPFLTAVLSMAPAVGEALFDETSADFARFLMGAVPAVLLLALALFANETLAADKGRGIANLLLFVGFLCTLLTALLLKKRPEMTPQKLILTALLLGSGLLLILEGFLVYRWLRFKEDLLRIFVLTLVSGVVFGLIAFVIDRVLSDALKCYGVLALGGCFGSLIYVTCIVMTHTFDGFEWKEVPGKALPVGIARWLRLY